MRFLAKFACHICSARAVQSGTLSASCKAASATFKTKKPAIIPTSKSEETTTMDTIWLRQQKQIAAKCLGRRRLSLARSGSCKRSLLSNAGQRLPLQLLEENFPRPTFTFGPPKKNTLKTKMQLSHCTYLWACRRAPWCARCPRNPGPGHVQVDT